MCKKCDSCGGNIVGSYGMKGEEMLCMDCFKCAKCGKTITGSYSLVDEDIVCSKCCGGVGVISVCWVWRGAALID